MKFTKYAGISLFLLFFLFASAYVSASESKGKIDPNLPTISYVQFDSFSPLDPSTPITVSAVLRMPNNDQTKSIPAVIVLHGSAGVDSRGAYYIEKLNLEGIATLELDMWAARNITDPADRPALPTLTLPDAFTALNYLSEVPGIDPQRIGLIGFSWGGVMAMLASTQSYTEIYGNGKKFAAQVTHYPVCWAYNIGLPGIHFSELTDSAVLIQVGDKDDYDEGGEACQNLVASLTIEEQQRTSVNVYPNSYHAWDRLQPAINFFDPFSHLGAGGYVDIIPNPGTANQARKKVVKFFQQAFETQD